MSFLYRLFKIPTTLSEFVDWSKKKGTDIDVTFEAQNSTTGHFGMGMMTFECYVGLSAGRRRIDLEKYTRVKSSNLLGVINAKNELAMTAMQKSISVAEEIMSMGVKATINGWDVDDFKKKAQVLS